jgi:hypothetical protein
MDAASYGANQFSVGRPNKLANSCSRLSKGVLLWLGFASERGGSGSLGRGARTGDDGVGTASVAGACSGDSAARAGVVGGRASVRGRGTPDGGIITASICSGAGPGATLAGVVDRRASFRERRARIGDESIGTASAVGACSRADAACAAVADGRAAVALGLRNAALS